MTDMSRPVKSRSKAIKQKSKAPRDKLSRVRSRAFSKGFLDGITATGSTVFRKTPNDYHILSIGSAWNVVGASIGVSIAQFESELTEDERKRLKQERSKPVGERAGA